MAGKIRITYRRARVSVEHVKQGACEACQAEGRTEMHHWIYAYTTDEVRAHPQLALDNTNEYCYKCHKVANAMKFLHEQEARAKLVRKQGGSWRMYKDAQERGSQSCGKKTRGGE